MQTIVIKFVKLIEFTLASLTPHAVMFSLGGMQQYYSIRSSALARSSTLTLILKSHCPKQLAPLLAEVEVVVCAPVVVPVPLLRLCLCQCQWCVCGASDTRLLASSAGLLEQCV